MKKKKEAGAFSLLGSASVMGLHFVTGPLVGGGLGWLIDKWLDTGPYGLGIGIVLGILAGYKNVLEDSKAMLKEENQNISSIEEENTSSPDPNTHVSYTLFGDEIKEEIKSHSPQNEEEKS